MKSKTYFKNIIKKAEALNSQLETLKKKAEALQNEIYDYADNYDYDNYIYFLRNLELTLDNLINFDLEDGIPYLDEYVEED